MISVGRGKVYAKASVVAKVVTASGSSSTTLPRISTRRIARNLALAQDNQPGQIGAGQILEDRTRSGRRDDDRGITVVDERADRDRDGADDAPGRILAQGFGRARFGLACRGGQPESSGRARLTTRSRPSGPL